MNYRILGRTGLKLSEIGLGGHEYRCFLPSAFGKREKNGYGEIIATHSARNEIIRKAVETGNKLNYFDTTFMKKQCR